MQNGLSGLPGFPWSSESAPVPYRLGTALWRLCAFLVGGSSIVRQARLRGAGACRPALREHDEYCLAPSPSWSTSPGLGMRPGYYRRSFSGPCGKTRSSAKAEEDKGGVLPPERGGPSAGSSGNPRGRMGLSGSQAEGSAPAPNLPIGHLLHEKPDWVCGGIGACHEKTQTRQ